MVALPIEDWMTRNVKTVKPRDTIEHARALMETHRIDQLPVVHNKQLVGIVTEGDISDVSPSVYDIAEGQLPHPQRRQSDHLHVRIEEVMTQKPITLSPSDPVHAAAAIMERERFGAIPIVSKNRLVGIVSRSDVLRAFVALTDFIERVRSIEPVVRTRGRQAGGA